MKDDRNSTDKKITRLNDLFSTQNFEIFPILLLQVVIIQDFFKSTHIKRKKKKINFDLKENHFSNWTVNVLIFNLD